MTETEWMASTNPRMMFDFLSRLEKCSQKLSNRKLLCWFKAYRTQASAADHAALLRDIAGNPFQPVVLPVPCPWLTPDVLSLAQECYDERDPDGTLDSVRLAILADALEEAGCEEQRCGTCKGRGAVGVEMCPECRGHQWHHPLLTHLRSLGPHVHGCWALDLILGKE